MNQPPEQSNPPRQKGDHMLVIILKSIGIAAILTGLAWAGTTIAFRYL